MAEESKIVGNEEVHVDSTDRGLFGLGKKQEKPTQENVVVSEPEKVNVSEPEVPKFEEEEKKEGFMEKLDTSAPTDEEEKEEEEEKRKNFTETLQEQLQEKISEISGESETEIKETYVPIEEPAVPEEKTGLLEKIKEKLPGQHTNPEEVPPPELVESTREVEDTPEKKGITEKIMEKLPVKHTDSEVVEPPVPVSDGIGEGEDKAEKKGIMEKIKQKLPGFNAKSEEEKAN